MANSGYCLIELVAAVGVAATVGAAAVPQLLATIDDSRALGAARYMSTQLQGARMQAVMRTANVAVRFTQSGSAYEYTLYQDGNGNGVLSRDIQRGVDPAMQPVERLPDRFAGVDFGALPGLPPADGAGTAPGTDPIRVGAGSMVSFTPLGTSTAGTLYIRGQRNIQYALIVFGETGRSRIVKFDVRSRQWRPL